MQLHMSLDNQRLILLTSVAIARDVEKKANTTGITARKAAHASLRVRAHDKVFRI